MEASVGTQAVVVRLPIPLLRRTEQFAQRLSLPGLHVTRAEAVRVLLMEALDAMSARELTGRKSGSQVA